ncbi:hypothetical protein HOF78_00355 [Candidatus Woesearchaeota archaeon]|jgi:hypothetical protein|nr:hypothetical protein [Candidatus Woesearchaeota archaeon]MBT6044582.1 hypothetical protein [Candidatus Woesearchaeota archaeon]
MKKGFHKLEHLVDKLIPYALLALLIVIIITFFFKDLAHTYEHQIEIVDIIVISLFVVDLGFKYIRVRKIKPFIKLYWLDILAVFPFYLFIRAAEEAYLLFRFSDTVKESQTALHAGIGIKEVTSIEKETARIVREAEKLGKMSRSKFAIRFIRPISRIPRFIKILPYFERTTGKHHAHDKKK